MFKLEVHNANVSVITVESGAGDETDTIPGNLATLTKTVIAMHRANENLDWLFDMVSDADCTRAHQAEQLANAMVEMLSNPNCPTEFRPLLAKYDLLG